MPFRVPQFNILVGVYTNFNPLVDSPPAARFTVRSQLRLIKASFANPAGEGPLATMLLLVPRGTDLRPNFGFTLGPEDIVQVPDGSGRWYAVLAVDDVAKGFANEYRVAAIFPIALTVAFPIP